MFKFIFKNRSSSANAMRIETENYKFLVTNKAEITDVEYQGVVVAKSISFADPLPFGLKERFEDTFRDLEEKAFNSLTNTTYQLSVERGRSKTTVFASGILSINGIHAEVKIIITATSQELIFEVRAHSQYKSFWGITVTIVAPSDAKPREAEKNDIRVFKRSEHAPILSYVMESEKHNTLITSTYGSGKITSNNEILLRPNVEGSDREVVNAWRLTNSLSNYNTIVLKTSPKN